MWCPIRDPRAAPALLLVLAACGESELRTVDVCFRGDRPELVAALVNGRLRIDVLDASQAVIASVESAADRPQAADDREARGGDQAGRRGSELDHPRRATRDEKERDQ